MKKVILLVEDNASDEKLTLFALKKCGVDHEVVVARDGAAALDYLLATGEHGDRDPADLPAVVLLDVQLPKIDGHEVLRRVRADARTRSVPVVMLTASNEERDVRESYAFGANAHVRKPVEYTAFAEAAKTLGLFWLSLNEPPPRTGEGA
jgi:two-component system response regulator